MSLNIKRLHLKRRKERFFFLATMCLLGFLLILSLPIDGQEKARAATETEQAEEELQNTLDELISSLDTQELQNFLDSLSVFEGISVKEKLRSVITGDFALDYNSVFEAAVGLIWEEGKVLIPAFTVILAATLLGGILNSAKNGFLQSTTSDIIHFITYLSVGAVVLSCLYGVLQSGYSAISSMQRQMEIVYPLLLTLMAASGGTVSVGIFKPAVAFMSGTICELFTAIVLPSAIIVIVLNFVGNLSDEIRVEKLTDLFKSVSRWLIGLTLGLFAIFITVQGITTAQYDGISLRALKYVISGSVPIVGGFLSGGMEIVLAGSALIKNALGAFALFVLIGSLIKPLALYIAFHLFLRLSAAATEPVGGKISKFLSSLAKDSGYYLASLLSIAFLYFLTIVLLICSTGAFF